MKFTLSVKVNPGSSKRTFEWRNDHLKVNLKSPPVDGEANDELLDAVEELFGLESGNVILKRGRTSTNKTLLLKGISRNELTDTLKTL
jgi:uncharacterized protein (TIGR00251 family)